MKPKSTRVRVLWCVLLAALAGSGALQADNNNPSIEACAGYAEADSVYEAALQQAKNAHAAAFRQADAVYKAADRQAWDARDAAQQATTAAYRQAAEAYEAAKQQAQDVERAALQQADAAYKPALRQADDAHKAALQQAKQAWATAYYASYDRDGGPRSDVHAVMVKFVEHHRQRCSELHGL